MPRALLRLIGAATVAAMLLIAAPQLARSQQRAEVTQPVRRAPPAPQDRQLPAPTGPGETLADLGDGIYELGGGGGLDAGIDGSMGADGGNARPPPPLDDASCQVAGGGDAALLGFLFAAGLLLRRRD